jgi:hypothetical protein
MTEAPTSATSTWISEPRQTLKRGKIDFRFVACTWRGSPSAKILSGYLCRKIGAGDGI